MANQGFSGSEAGSVAAISTSPAVTPSKTMRNKGKSKNATKVKGINMLPKNAKARPLNSWMAFRSFYHGIFNGVQQKHASTHLTTLWQQDPFQAKWAVVAKTYTLIKDKVGKKMAPLDVFLKLTCPKMGIIAVGDYLKMLNWTVAREEGVLKLTQIGRPNLGTLNRAVVDCSMSHIDLLQYVLDSGYLDGVDNNFTNEVDHSSVHMLVSSAINFPEQAEVAFTRAIQKDPKAIAAFIFGTGLDSRFFDISAGQSDVLVHTDGKQLANNILPIPVALPTNVSDPVHPGQLVEQMATIGYPWTGNMSQLYRPSEMAIDFEAMMEENEWAVTDIGNPLEMDNYLKAVGGFNDDDLYAGYNGEPTNMLYQFGDSF